MNSKTLLRCAVIGYGYWGPHLVRNLVQCKGVELLAVVDRDENRRKLASDKYPNLEIYEDIAGLFINQQIDAVVIATPAATHFELAKKCIEEGCHVLIEKPITTSYKDAKELVDLAKARGTTLMVDHTYLYSEPVRRIHKLINAGEIGELVYFDSQRVNLGLFQPDISVLWDLAVHDLSMLFYFVPELPLSVSATGGSFMKSKFEAAMFLTLRYRSDFFAHINVSWLSPVKVRRTVISGSSRTVLFDDTETDSKIRLYDAGVDEIRENEVSLLSYRLGDIMIPKLPASEPLMQEIVHFVECIRLDLEPISSGRASLPIIRTLEAASLSSSLSGTSVKIDWSTGQ
jgi:predicted dehydrogenase